MQKINIWFLLLITISPVSYSNKITIELQLKSYSVDADYSIYVTDLSAPWHEQKKFQFTKSDSLISFSISANAPMVFSWSKKLPGGRMPFTLVPGDSVRVSEVDNSFLFSGKGSEIFLMMNQLFKAESLYNAPKTMKSTSKVNSRDAYFSIMDHLSRFQIYCLEVLDRFSAKVPAVSVQYFKAKYISFFQSAMGKGMVALAKQSDSTKLSATELSSVYDSVIRRHGSKLFTIVDTLSITGYPSTLGGDFIKVAYWRSKQFVLNEADIENSNWEPVYRFAKQFYKGLAQRRALTWIVAFRFIAESYSTYEELVAIKDFLSLDGYSGINKHVAHLFESSRGYSIEDVHPDMFSDGPYIFYKDSRVWVRSIDVTDQVPVKNEYVKLHSDFSTVMIRVGAGSKATDSFEVTIKSKLEPCKSEFKQPSRLLAVSDIEGNFKAFKELLQANRVIDKNFNWIFGDGHLVLLGDFVDRGNQVTELLWFIYLLEDKAKMHNGYVHFILGNHEIMNLTNKLKYVHMKYKHTARMLGEEYSNGLYGQNSELGRWLRTKNVVEKIGQMLYVHGGISSTVNQLQLPLSTINSMVHKQLIHLPSPIKNDTLAIITNSRTGPYWYRGYYTGDVSERQVDSSLAFYNVDQIVTGHTLIRSGREITTHFNAKVINIDTHHASGFSEALLVENGRCYAVKKDEKKALQMVSNR